jgi:predicted nucleic acid-binding protein
VIFLEANVFLRQLTAPTDDATHRMQEQVIDLFERIESDEVQATSSEVVLHETCYVLSSARQYGRAPADFVPDLAYLLTLAGVRFPRGDQAIYLRALDLYAERPKLEFSDAVIAARCEAAGHDLATFDRRFDAIETVTRWRWEPPAS